MNNNSNTNNKEEKKEKLYYKYRGIENFRFFLDILVNNRLYASNFKNMNDPMEGFYLYRNDGSINKEFQEKLYSQKENLKICSLSKNPDNFLMWSHYANGHRGIAIEVKIKDGYEVKDIEYVEKLIEVNNSEDNPEKLAKDILSKKISLWDYEQEVRVFSKTKYVEVEIQKIIIGHKMPNMDKEFIRKLIKKINPNIEVEEQPKTNE